MAKIASSITLPPEAQRALRGKVVEWAVVASLATALVFGGLWTWSSREAARVGLDRTASVSFQLAATLLMQVLEAAGSEAMRSAEAPAMAAILLGPGRSAADQALQVAAATRSGLAAFVLLDRQGVPVAWTEDDPAVAELAAQLQPRSATDADLDYVMRGVALRKELAGAKPGATRALELKGSMRLVASAPVRDAMGSVVGSLHGVVGFEALAGALTLDPSPLGTRLLLLDGNGTTVTAGPGPAGDWGARRVQQLEGFAGADWSLVLEQSAAESLRPLVLPAAASLASAAALALVFGLLALRSGSRQARPLWELYLGLRKARDGQAVELAVPQMQGEAESLTLAFNDTMRRLHESRGTLERELAALREQNSAFQSQRRMLAQLTVTDPLTQLANRRSFEDQLAKEIKRLSRHKEGLAMLVVDIDDFKKVNDELGHAAGDEFLVQVARILKEQARETDVVARYGGEEFVVIAPSTDLDGAVVLAERMRTAVAEASFIVEETKRLRSATVSIGVATYKGSQTGLFNSADGALYEAKAAGKNCVRAVE